MVDCAEALAALPARSSRHPSSGWSRLELPLRAGLAISFARGRRNRLFADLSMVNKDQGRRIRPRLDGTPNAGCGARAGRGPVARSTRERARSVYPE